MAEKQSQIILQHFLSSCGWYFHLYPASAYEDIDVKMMNIPSVSGAADDLFDPVSEPGDASVDAIVVWTPAAFAPAHHPSQEPASRRLLAHQGTTRVSLTETGDV